MSTLEEVIKIAERATELALADIENARRAWQEVANRLPKTLAAPAQAKSQRAL